MSFSICGRLESAGNLRPFMVPMRGLRAVVATHEPRSGFGGLAGSKAVLKPPQSKPWRAPARSRAARSVWTAAASAPLFPGAGSRGEIAAAGGPLVLSMNRLIRTQRFGADKDSKAHLCPPLIFGSSAFGSWSQGAGFGPWRLPMNLCRRLPAAVRGQPQFEGASSKPPATRRLQVAGTGLGSHIASFGGSWVLSRRARPG